MNEDTRSITSRVDEPFRIFFPIGMLIGIAGVALWPLFYSGWLTFYPVNAHTRLMIEGFTGFFIFGFLMTAGPRLLGVKAFTSISVYSILALGCVSSLAHLLNHSVIGDLFFAAAILWTLLNARSAFSNRQDTPPPGFPLAALGMLCGLFGSLALAASSSIYPNAIIFQLGKILLYQGFTMLPVVGVGAFFFPRILGGANKHDFPEMMVPNDEWRRRFKRSLYVSIAFIASIVLELMSHTQLAYGLRVVALTAYMLSEVPFHKFKPKSSMHGSQLIFTLATIVIGLAGAALFPLYRVAWLHAYLLTGLTSVIFLVSIRVVFGHSGRPDLIRKSVNISKWITGALILAAAARIFADYSMDNRITHYIYASIIWLICGLAWMIFVAPKARQINEEDPGNC